jgi:hypothetical protein
MHFTYRHGCGQCSMVPGTIVCKMERDGNGLEMPVDQTLNAVFPARSSFEGDMSSESYRYDGVTRERMTMDWKCKLIRDDRNDRELSLKLSVDLDLIFGEGNVRGRDPPQSYLILGKFERIIQA